MSKPLYARTYCLNSPKFFKNLIARVIKFVPASQPHLGGGTLVLQVAAGLVIKVHVATMEQQVELVKHVPTAKASPFLEYIISCKSAIIVIALIDHEIIKGNNGNNDNGLSLP